MYKLLSILALVAASAPTTAATPTANTDQKAATKTVPAKKYCMQMDEMTGSRVRESECRTKEDWKRRGVDVDDLQAKSGRSDTQG